jgi:hypothetical protein
MNTIASFGLCTLSDEELMKKVDAMTDEMYKKMEIPTRHIPSLPNDDYDLLVGELLLRFKGIIEFVKTDGFRLAIETTEDRQKQYENLLDANISEVEKARCKGKADAFKETSMMLRGALPRF